MLLGSFNKKGSDYHGLNIGILKILYIVGEVKKVFGEIREGFLG
jgi:hypothetical protein